MQTCVRSMPGGSPHHAKRHATCTVNKRGL
eukprot:CCRYP_000470-RA/>CCRYP_000470-RA protein AED:0.38 eAED:0.92 QI:0/-1/0/1/-1/0/1/0/29